MKIKIKLIAIFFFIFQPAIAADLPKEIPQGSLIVGQSSDADEIIVDNNFKLAVSQIHILINRAKYPIVFVGSSLGASVMRAAERQSIRTG